MAIRRFSLVTSTLIAIALPICSARAQGVPDVGPNGAISTVQATDCVPPGTDKYNHCGWGVWSFETQRSVLIASLAEPASYLICREQVDAGEANGYPVVAEVDGVSSPGVGAVGSQSGCFIVSGKQIVLSSAAKPKKPARGYYIRLGTTTIFSNSVGWTISKGAGAGSPERVVLAQVPQRRVFRVCFGRYNPLLNPPPYLHEYKLVVDKNYMVFRGTEQAIINYGSCVDVSGSTVAVEPVWAAADPTVGGGRLVF